MSRCIMENQCDFAGHVLERSLRAINTLDHLAVVMVSMIATVTLKQTHFRMEEEKRQDSEKDQRNRGSISNIERHT
jgi:hypothetical protein